MAEKNVDLELILHIIPPPMRLNWSTPRSLFISTFLNHARGDKAPIGHVFIEFPLPKNASLNVSPKIAPLLVGAHRVITGMTRQKMTVIESLKVVQGKRLGLGSFYYDFKGKLDSIKEAHEEIAWAKARGRLATIHVSISEEKAQLMMEFLKEWIEHGSFRHYSGGLRVDCGEGSGCAEFGMHYLSMALGVHATNPEWVRRVRVPHDLIGGGFAGHAERVSMFQIFKNGDRWAYGSEPHHVYSVPDPELIFDWIKNHASVSNKTGAPSVTMIPGAVNWSSGEFVRREFEVKYPLESMGSVQEQWAKVTDSKNVK